MIMMIDTSTPTCRLVMIEGEWRLEDEWEAGRDLAKQLLGYLEGMLVSSEKSWADITGFAVYRGPGSFTGLRIGLTVFNTLADALSVPIVGEHGEDWQKAALARLQAGENDQIVMPEYGGDAHITAPRK